MLRLLCVTVLLAQALATPPGSGDRLVRVYGDLATADRVAVIVPGADTTAATFESSFRRPGGAARALLAEADRLQPGHRLAVVAWLGYDSPATVSVRALTDAAARKGYAALRTTVERLPRVPVTLLCHSYGSAVCAGARVPGARVVAFGSPGLGDVRVPDLWAGRGEADWIRFVPHIKIGVLGFGADPMAPGGGARLFDAGPGGHSDYFRPGTLSLRNLALLALGRTGEVTLEKAARS
ncbi:alpha/beta hydrolase [Nonomuraea sp. NPDC050663]|uniref:alpha/beta hydrolase n=1 Tax=Nonomuraea sp. NPDC050663 TaxID=3364370 RepID=UPI0037AE6421